MSKLKALLTLFYSDNHNNSNISQDCDTQPRVKSLNNNPMSFENLAADLVSTVHDIKSKKEALWKEVCEDEEEI
jgi:hypothetical protein